MKTATLLPDEVAHDETGIPFVSTTGVYKLDPPLMVSDGIADYVVASTLDETIPTSQGVRRIYETNLLISDSEGMVVDWNELPGSGHNRDHAQAFAAVGYTITHVGVPA
ncbi:hypothetical protein ACFWU5_16540 [Nocardia sp. NPDC058640]|uniref:hypothetical protein n=1 Tax=Nocardia sp. NPDC058640 TaxID=3346571 RepID=UPI00365FC741